MCKQNSLTWNEVANSHPALADARAIVAKQNSQGPVERDLKLEVYGLMDRAEDAEDKIAVLGLMAFVHKMTARGWLGVVETLSAGMNEGDTAADCVEWLADEFTEYDDHAATVGMIAAMRDGGAIPCLLAARI